MKKIFRARDFQPDAARDVEDELRSHLELKVEDLLAQGMPEGEARELARRELLAARQSKGRAMAEAHTGSRLRRQEVMGRLENLWRDLRFGARGMVKNPGFTLIALLSLTIGIGANTAVFSVVNGLFLRPPPFTEPETLVSVYTGTPDTPPASDVRWSEFEGLMEVEGPFQAVGAFDGIFTGLRDPSGTRSAFVEAMTPNLFPLLGVQLHLGRSFLPDEGSAPGGDPLAILGYRYAVRPEGRVTAADGEAVQYAGVGDPDQEQEGTGQCDQPQAGGHAREGRDRIAEPGARLLLL